MSINTKDNISNLFHAAANENLLESSLISYLSF